MHSHYCNTTGAREKHYYIQAIEFHMPTTNLDYLVNSLKITTPSASINLDYLVNGWDIEIVPQLAVYHYIRVHNNESLYRSTAMDIMSMDK